MTAKTSIALAVTLLGVHPQAHAGLYRAVDATGHMVVTNLRSGAARPVSQSHGTLSFATPPGGPGPARPLVIETERARRISPEKQAKYKDHVTAAAERYQVPPRLLEAVIAVESDFEPRAVSRKGARGLMQLMPDTARSLAVDDSFDPAANIHGGARYLRELLDQFGQNMTLALAAYNAGPSAVQRAGGVPRIAETQDYVNKVRAFLGHSMLVFGSSALTSVRAADGRVRVTNLGHTQSSVRAFRDARGVLQITNH